MFTLEIMLFIACSIFIWFVFARAMIPYLQEFHFLKNSNSWEDALIRWIFLAPVCIIISILLFSFDRIAYGSDWFAYFLYHQVVLDSIKNGELLHWSTTISGGYPFAGHPENPSTTILMIPIILFGVIFGVKVNIAIMYILCVAGTFLLARKYLHLSIFSSSVISSMIISSTLVAVRVYTQKYTNIFEFLTPLCLFLFLESLYAPVSNQSFLKNQRYWALCGTSIIVAMMLYQGKLAAVVTLLFLFCIFIYALFRSQRGDRIRVLFTFTIMLIFTVLLAAPKILPMIELLQIDSRYVSDWERLRYHIYTPRTLIKALVTYKHDEIAWVFGNQIIGLGVIPLLLAFYSLFASTKKALPWFLMGIFFILIVLGDNSPFPLGYYLWHLPILHSMEDLDKYFSSYIMFSIAVLAGFGLEKIRNISFLGRNIALFTALIILTMLTVSSASIHEGSFKSVIPKFDKEKEFYFVEKPQVTGLLNEDYLYDLQNIGTINSYVNIKYPNSAQARYKIKTDFLREKNPLYRGESYIEGGDGVVKIKGRSQNRIELSVRTTKPGILVINQNYNKYWHTSVGKILNDGSGLLKVLIEKPGEYILTVYNTNTLCLIGGILYLVAIIIFYPVSKIFSKLAHKDLNDNSYKCGEQ